MGLEETRVAIAEFLQISIINTTLISINFWSVVHFFTGGLILFLLFKIAKNKTVNYKFSILLFLLFLWEVFEYINYAVLQGGYFIPETSANIVSDLIIGMLGGLIVYRFKK